MGRSTQQKAKCNQKRMQDKMRLLQGIQDARGILRPNIPDTAQSASQPAQQERVVFILHQDLKVKTHTGKSQRQEAAQVVLYKWISLLAIKQANPAHLNLDIASVD
ncbi:hypothetical protein JCM11641_006051 [Rhodosporidiobolus odoratus]